MGRVGSGPNRGEELQGLGMGWKTESGEGVEEGVGRMDGRDRRVRRSVCGKKTGQEEEEEVCNLSTSAKLNSRRRATAAKPEGLEMKEVCNLSTSATAPLANLNLSKLNHNFRHLFQLILKNITSILHHRYSV